MIAKNNMATEKNARIKVFIKPYDKVVVNKLPKVCETECARLKDKYKSERKKAAYALLCDVVGRLYGIYDAYRYIGKNGFDKPEFISEFLPAELKKIKFSVSHSYDLVAVAVSDSAIGVDVEKVRDKIASGLSEKISGQSEKEELLRFATAGDKEFSEEVIKLWSKKEALFKAGLVGQVFLPKTADLSLIHI